MPMYHGKSLAVLSPPMASFRWEPPIGGRGWLVEQGRGTEGLRCTFALSAQLHISRSNTRRISQAFYSIAISIARHTLLGVARAVLSPLACLNFGINFEPFFCFSPSTERLSSSGSEGLCPSTNFSRENLNPSYSASLCMSEPPEMYS